MSLTRTGVFVRATGIAKLLSGESQCLWSHWFPAHHKYEKRSSDFDTNAWVIRHAAMVDAEAARLRAEGYTVFTENQNRLRFERDGITLGGQPDVIAVKGNHVLIRDVKTGAGRAWHSAQMAIYLAMVPCARPAWADYSLEGAVLYADGSRALVTPDDLTQSFRTRLSEFVHLVGGPEPPARMPSVGECKFCDIGTEDCPDRMDADDDPPVTEHDLF